MPTEFELIESIGKWLPKPSSRVFKGVGDDAAVVKSPRGRLVVSVDMMVENVHFDLAYTIPQELGHKAMAINLSDMAAMGAKPLYALVSIAVPKTVSIAFMKDLYKGLSRLASNYQLEIVGGNLSQANRRMALDITIIGEMIHKPILRSGARVGDYLVVTGKLGSAAAGLTLLKKKGRGALLTHASLVKSQLLPKPRVQIGLHLAKSGLIHSMIDISDGLASEVNHLASDSGVGFLVDLKSIPMSPSMLQIAKEFHKSPISWALNGGEDYELLFTVSKKSWPKVKKIFQKLHAKSYIIGECVNKKEGVKLVELNGHVKPLTSKGWDHFEM